MSENKTTLMRTVLNEKQLLTLRTCYDVNPRPDAIMREQLAEMTRLSSRVIHTWFQNKQCKDKKKSALAKQIQEEQKVLTSLNHSIPLGASSHIPDDMNIGLPPPSHIPDDMNSMSKNKTTLMRTVLNEKQLLMLRTCYGVNPRPDALLKEQLAEMTQLSSRVIHVWFQNKQCKDKKKNALAKQIQEEQKVLTSLNHSIPLGASSHIPNDMNIDLPSPSLDEVQYHSDDPRKTDNETYPSFSNDYHHSQQQQQTFHDNVLNGLALEDDSNCFDTSEFNEEHSDTICDGSAIDQLTL
ncbi:unnamed protein product [Adineta steineri]|uniref:Homeobox domain-containing protein n=1 Tax=Adineta steineri TaxID=433720 RepID=A0A814K7H9_9BILA|nr:unnamed protein product [Adineta steineri]CAF1081044.1 unnamed protein product [Adineta steineri]